MQDDTLKTAGVGAGHAGIATATGLAEQGREVVLVEQDPGRLGALADEAEPVPRTGVARGVRDPARLRTDHAEPAEPPNGLPLDPVSYTHLRAHETRHDLVCRLL